MVQENDNVLIYSIENVKKAPYTYTKSSIYPGFNTIRNKLAIKSNDILNIYDFRKSLEVPILTRKINKTDDFKICGDYIVEKLRKARRLHITRLKI